MNKLTASKPYALAIFKIAKENNSFSAWLDELNKFSLFAQDSAMVKLINNSSILAEEKANFFKECTDASEDSFELLKILADNNKLGIIPEIKTTFENLYAKEVNTLQAEVISPQELSDSQKKMITEKLEKSFNCSLEFTYKLDTTLIGGYIAKVNDYVIDNTIKGRLKSLEEFF